VAVRSEDPKIIIRAINFELVQPICSRYIDVTDRQRTTYDGNTALALRVSRVKTKTLLYLVLIVSSADGQSTCIHVVVHLVVIQ